MNIAIVGAGALGSVYALGLAHVTPVTLVVRDRARAPQRILAEKIGGKGPSVATLEDPRIDVRVPDDAEVVLVAVRHEQLSDELFASLASARDARVVVTLTPVLPPLWGRVQTQLSDRWVPARSGVAAYEPDLDPPVNERRLRFWTPHASPTLLEERAASDPRRDTVHALARLLTEGGIPAQVQPAVRNLNAATTVAFFPILLAIEAAGGSIASLLAEDGLLRLALEAGKEARALARAVGPLPSFASAFFSFASPFTVRTGLRIARKRYPEAILFLERHFGSKLHTQNESLMSAIEAMAADHRSTIDSIRRLAERARVRRASRP
jgi:2-dehydropantoate 2-reductase